ncbi:hypothetical protein SAMN04489740_4087 [Arthrobacter alpinus]|uniref:Uncharacterized protein n=1 Tax=Arthrobacter alpinus TaxID=656366 RepID=A0A1H5PBY3_9MICC|nr:hypothetical protein [Arthrobacter alpinus]SEF11286.1 hypothetical protein SAMN04489740_4087 [Arthrobacter alpinus]
MPDYIDTLIRTVIDASEASTWSDAVLEWTIYNLEEDPRGQGVCVCGHPHLVQMFTIRNVLNGRTLHPIGNECVKKFERKDLKLDAALLGDLYKLRNAINEGEAELTSAYFSRTLLADLNARGAFTPDDYSQDGGYSFMVNMFNKRNKDELTGKQRFRTKKLLVGKIFPFVRADERLR